MGVIHSLRSLVARRWLTLLFIGGAGIIAFYILFGRSASLGATFTVARSDFREQVSISGTVTAAQDVALGFAANGRIAQIYATVGDQVSAGAVLAETENGDLVAALSQKQSALREAQARLTELQAGPQPEEIAVARTNVANAAAVLKHSIQNAYTVSDDAVHNRVDSFFTNPRTVPKLAFTASNATLVATVEQDRVAVEPVLSAWAHLVASLTDDTVVVAAKQAREYMSRVTTLLADANTVLNQGVPDQTTSATTLASYVTTLGVARTNVNTAATTLIANAAALDAAVSALKFDVAGASEETLAVQEAAVAAAEADVRSAAAQLAKTRVVAPFKGTVTRMDAEVGEIVSPTTSQISLQSDGVFQIVIYIPEVTIARVMAGAPATTTLDAYGPRITFPSVVVAVDPAETIKDGVPTYKTTLSFRLADSRIRSGMTANVLIETGQLNQAIVIPAGAIGTKNGAPYVSVVIEGEAMMRPVTLGPTPALGQAHVVSGLTGGEEILLAPVP
ncbi:MAG: efflux RND transporter periplasmic adaptor subunit [Patescibacteria group bacterium]